MKKTILALLVLSSFSAFANSNCQLASEKVAMTLFALENSASSLDSIQVSVSQEASIKPNSVNWRISFLDTEEDSEFEKQYEVQMHNYEADDANACSLESVEVKTAG